MTTRELDQALRQYGEEHGRFQLLSELLRHVAALSLSDQVRRAEFICEGFTLTIRKTGNRKS